MNNKMQWFKEAGLGMFIHWGVYAVLAGEFKSEIMGGNKYAEQINNNMKIKNADYEKYAAAFNPIDFDAEEWVKIAKDAGMKYMIITSKHQDGFCMYDTKYSDYSIVKASPFKRDPIKELSKVCRANGIKFGLYYSNARDFHEAGANWNNYGNTWDYPPQTEEDFSKYYYSKVMNQVEELLTGYGEISVIWFDVPYKLTSKMSGDLRDKVLSLQPGCIINSRIGNGFGDYISMEDNEVPDEGLSEPWESCITMNDTWGYSRRDMKYKSADDIIKIYDSIIKKGGTLLLNVGPDYLGNIPFEQKEILKKLGEHIKSK